MKFPLLVAVAFACLSFAVSAAECEFPFDATVGSFSAAGAVPVIIPADDLPAVVDQMESIIGADLGYVTRGFFVSVGGSILLGLEVDGCLLPPYRVATAAPSADQLSGRDKSTGRIGA